MSVLRAEIDNVQNPGLGSFLIWRFVSGYQEKVNDGSGTPLLYAFLVLPLVYNKQVREIISGTQNRTGLRGFAAKFGQANSQYSDKLLSLHSRVDVMRAVSLESLRMAIAYKLVALDSERGVLFSLSQTMPRRHIEADVRDLARQSEKIGKWFSMLTPFEVLTILKIRP